MCISNLGNNISFMKLKEKYKNRNMLMHSCYCVFISVTGGFVQMLKDLKNLLKMSLKILFIKRKRKISFHLLPFLVFGPFPSAGPSPPRSPAQPPPPCALRGPASAPAQPRSSPAFCGRPATVAAPPSPAADAWAPPVGAVSFPARLGNRPRPAPEQPPPTHCASWERFPPLLGLDK